MVPAASAQRTKTHYIAGAATHVTPVGCVAAAGMPFDGHDRLTALVVDGEAGDVGLAVHRALRRPDHRHRPQDLLLATQHDLQWLLLVQRLLHSTAPRMQEACPSIVQLTA